MAKFIVDTTDNKTSKSMLEMILEEHLDYNVYVKPVDEKEFNDIDNECGIEDIISTLPKVKIVDNISFNLHFGWESSYWFVGYCKTDNRNCTLAHPSGWGQTLEDALYNFINELKEQGNG